MIPTKQVIYVSIKSKHLKKLSQRIDKCPMALALREQFRLSHPMIGFHFVRFHDTNQDFENSKTGSFYKIDSNGTKFMIRIRKGQKVQPLRVKLTRYTVEEFLQYEPKNT